jgi:hypothetical protein
MIVVATLFASLLGLCIGVVVPQSLYGLVVALLVPGVYWMLKRSNDHSRADIIHSSSLPSSIFKSEFDDVSFYDDTTDSTKKKAVLMSFGYLAGVPSGNLLTTMMIPTLS